MQNINKGMTKAQAMEAVKHGQKVRHFLFALDEFIYMKNGLLFDECDIELDASKFWMHRSDIRYESGWHIFQEQIIEPFPEHVHIPFKYGHITWEGKEPPTQEQMDVFTRLAEAVLRKKPKIVCLCGSTRFYDAFREANLKLTMQGIIVLTIGYDTKSDIDLFGNLKDKDILKIKEDLDELHLRKIDLCDEVFVLNVGGYIGESTRKEIDYSVKNGKPVKYLEQ